MYTIRFSPTAEKDLTETVLYLSHNLKSPLAASNLLDTIQERLDQISLFPHSSPLLNIQSLKGKELHILTIENYLLFYRVLEEKKVISLIRFLYGRREWAGILEDSDMTPFT